MAEKRKLLNEIDKCYKKIDEGFEIFDDIMEKMNEANSDNQREKFQDDLKKEIKKLQRLRDQIKGWQNSSEIKDKDSLSKFRKLIEQRMEIFKDVERENKTKPHSKQGLSAEDKLDPREKEKCDTIEWLNCQMRRIQDEIDRTESKLETLSSMADSNRKRGKKDDVKKNEKEKAEELRKHLERVKFHLLNLEVCMRMINNEKLEIKDVLGKLKEPLEMYIDALDPENDDDPESLDPEDIYEELNFGTYLSQLGSMTTTTSVDDEKCCPLQQQQPQQNDNGCTTTTSVSPQVSIKEKQPPQLNVVASPTMPTAAAAAATTPPDTAAATGGGGGGSGSTWASVITISINEKQQQHQQQQQNVVSSPTTIVSAAAAGATTSPETTMTGGGATPAATSDATSSATSGSQSSTTTTTQEEVFLFNGTESPQLKSRGESSAEEVLCSAGWGNESRQLDVSSPTIAATAFAAAVVEHTSETTTGVGSTTSTNGGGVIPMSINEKQQPQKLNVSSPTVSSAATASTPERTTSGATPAAVNTTPATSGSATTTNNTTTQEEVFLFNGTESQQPKSREPQETVIPPWLGASPLGMVALNEDLNYQLQMLDTTLTRCPVQMDSEKTRSYLPKMPCQTPLYYPQAPLPNADSLEYYLRLSVEALFFTFYYMEGSRAQLLAAKALKKLSWRFHTKYLMWFQRHEEPKQITDDFEQGTYVYFDFEKWVQRKKEQFTFEYKYLEDKDFE